MLKDFISTLKESSQYSLALHLTRRSLPIWDDYARTNELKYLDTVVGMHHTVAKDLLSRTLTTIEQELLNPSSQLKQIDLLRREFSDPNVAMQDLDWEVPAPVELTFYSVKNLLDKISREELTVFNEPQIYVVINQALDALSQVKIMSPIDIDTLLESYMN